MGCLFVGLFLLALVIFVGSWAYAFLAFYIAAWLFALTVILWVLALAVRVIRTLFRGY